MLHTVPFHPQFSPRSNAYHSNYMVPPPKGIAQPLMDFSRTPGRFVQQYSTNWDACKTPSPRRSPPSRFNTPGTLSTSYSSNDSRTPNSLNGSFRRRSNLPRWTVDADGTPTVPIGRLLDKGLLDVFVKDRAGNEYLQAQTRGASQAVRARVINTICRYRLFDEYCNDVIANFFIQSLVASADEVEQGMILDHLRGKVLGYCYERYACRVIQVAVENFCLEYKMVILEELRGASVHVLAIGQNSNHVIQKVMTTMSSSCWDFIVQAMSSSFEILSAIVGDKYGCRIVQLCIERLLEEKRRPNEGDGHADDRLQRILCCILNGAKSLISNEFANYVIQLIIRTPDLGFERDFLIKNYIQDVVLSYSQEKFASHVIECAFQHAPPDILLNLMDEVFDGYQPEEHTGRDALDVMLFHQYANYVVQRMFHILTQYAKRDDNSNICQPMLGWYKRLCERIRGNEERLQRYSSGQKLLEAVKENASLNIPV